LTVLRAAQLPPQEAPKKTTIRYKAKSHQDIGVPGLRGVQHGSSLNAPCA
jgi:hypothetical protein